MQIHLGFVNSDTLLNADLQKYTFYINYAFHSKLIFITSHDLGIMCFERIELDVCELIVLIINVNSKKFFLCVLSQGCYFHPKIQEQLNFFSDFHRKENVRLHLRSVFFSISYLAVLT